MKLLKKKEIDSLKALEKKKEIDEGLKLAKRIDNLREVASEEEASLERFRQKTVKSINDEITTIYSKKDFLLKEVKELENKKKEALIPLTEEWDRVKEVSQKLSLRITQVDDKELLLNSKEKELKEKESDLIVEEWRIKEERDRSVKALTQAEALKAEAREVNDRAKKLRVEVNEEAKQQEKVHSLRERELRNLEAELKLRKNKMDLREKKQNERERFINDKYETLLRAEKYVK